MPLNNFKDMTVRQWDALKFMRRYGAHLMLVGKRVVYVDPLDRQAMPTDLTKRDALWLADNGFLVPTASSDNTRVYQRVR